MEQALPKVLGILGGLGPMATVYFYEMLTRHTQAARDQDHIDVIINSRATTPDRTSYILGQSAENPFDIMAADAARLVTFGADVIAIPCNTAHYFYDRLNETIPIPILNMVEETVLAAKAGGSARVGILATTGTVRTRTYQRMCEKHGLPCAVPLICQTVDPAHIQPTSLPPSSISAAPLQLFTGGTVKIALSSRYSQVPVNGLRDTTRSSVTASSP